MDSGKILVVQTSMISSFDIAKDLGKNGYQITKAGTGKEALDILRNYHHDLVMIDFESPVRGIPDIDLMKLAETLNADFEILSIFIAKYWDPETRKTAYNQSPDAYLLKPVNPSQLLVTVERLLHNGKKEDSPLNGSSKKCPQYADKSFFIKEKGCYHKVDLGDLEKVVSDRDIIHIHLKSDPTHFTVSLGLKQFQQQFPFPALQRINKSCIINLQHIRKFNHNYVWLNGNPISIGEKFRKEFFEKVNILKTGWKTLGKE